MNNKKNVLVCGGAITFGNFENADMLLEEISKKLIINSYNIITGYGKCIGEIFVKTALKEIYANKDNIEDRLVVRPFPNDVEIVELLTQEMETVTPKNIEIQAEAFWKQYLEHITSISNISIFLFGNKKNELTNEIIDSDGMIDEFNSSIKAKNYIIPVGVTGYTSFKILEEIEKNILDYWYLKDSIEILKNEKDIQKLTEEIFVILERIAKERK